jgi:UDPglucose--hexose-1-phosphate uridylyltransferase
MPEVRKDPITGGWVIISTDRARRPHDFHRASTAKSGGFCPFCYGSEAKTPPEILAYRENGNHTPNSEGWLLRVVPNRFPALQIEGDMGRVGEGLYDKMNGIGAHEIIIETPHHDSTIPTMTDTEVESMFWAYRDRLIDLKRDRRFRYILIFKNHGEAAGASLEHSHSQLIALPIVPSKVREEVEGAKRYYGLKERCIYCDIIRQELDDHHRVITENSDFVAVAPYAPRFPFETWILPKHHESSYEESLRLEYKNLARITKDVLSRLDKALENPPYNMIVHTSPIAEVHNDYYHWHIEIMPTLTRVAGFEWGTGFYINPTPPEESAKFMREIIE